MRMLTNFPRARWRRWLHITGLEIIIKTQNFAIVYIQITVHSGLDSTDVLWSITADTGVTRFCCLHTVTVDLSSLYNVFISHSQPKSCPKDMFVSNAMNNCWDDEEWVMKIYSRLPLPQACEECVGPLWPYFTVASLVSHMRRAALMLLETHNFITHAFIFTLRHVPVRCTNVSFHLHLRKSK